MRRPPPPHPAGSPKTPGSGRRKGSLNRRTVELRGLMAAIAGDVSYQRKLREDFIKRRVHHTIEALVWAYAIGKPKDQIEMSAKLSTDDRLAAERELFSRLDIRQLEGLAAESQALVDKAMAMVKANAGTPSAASAPRAPAECGVSSDAPAPTYSGIDLARSGNGPASANIHARRTLALVAASASPGASVEGIPPGEPADRSTPPAVTDEQNAARADTTTRDTNDDVSPNEPWPARRQRGRVVELLKPEKAN